MPIEGSNRHYVGPEQPLTPPPPMPSLPSAEELLPSKKATTPQTAFMLWYSENEHWLHDEAPPLDHKLETAFLAGVAHAQVVAQRTLRDSLLDSARGSQTPRDSLEGTIESRTIIAALTFFRDQVLVHGPEEVSTGEWLQARDIDALIASFKRR